MWDLVVFDEAHHLTAYRNGNKVTKTENYKLAEALRDHTRDLLLLSATPHQGDHYRFWMLVRLLDPTMFKSAEDMVGKSAPAEHAGVPSHEGGCLSSRRLLAVCSPVGTH